MRIIFENGESIEIKRKFDGSEIMTIKIELPEIHPGLLEAKAIAAVIAAVIKDIDERD